jgi:hypothetical protein
LPLRLDETGLRLSGVDIHVPWTGVAAGELIRYLRVANSGQSTNVDRSSGYFPAPVVVERLVHCWLC